MQLCPFVVHSCEYYGVYLCGAVHYKYAVKALVHDHLNESVICSVMYKVIILHLF